MRTLCRHISFVRCCADIVSTLCGYTSPGIYVRTMSALYPSSVFSSGSGFHPLCFKWRVFSAHSVRCWKNHDGRTTLGSRMKQTRRQFQLYTPCLPIWVIRISYFNFNLKIHKVCWKYHRKNSGAINQDPVIIPKDACEFHLIVQTILTFESGNIFQHPVFMYFLL